MSVIVWFKNDLRVRDNAVLYAALQSNEPIIPLYCLHPSQFATTQFGFRKTGIFRARFLLESVRDLDNQLRELGSGLLVKQGMPEKVLADVAAEYGASKVYTASEAGLEEIQQINQTKAILTSLNCELYTIDNFALLHRDDYSSLLSNIPDVFTDFRHIVEKSWVVRNECPISNQIKGLITL